MKKIMTVVIIVIAIIAFILVGWYVMFMHWGIGPVFPFMKGEVNPEWRHIIPMKIYNR